MALRGFAELEELFGIRADGGQPRSFNGIANAAIDGFGDTRPGVYVDAASTGETRIDRRKNNWRGWNDIGGECGNAIHRSRDTGESYTDYLTKLAKASGIETPTREDLARLDRNRAKKGSNEEWEHPDDPDAKITKMKDGQTHLGAQGGTCCGYGNRGCAGGDAAGCQRRRHDDDSANTNRSHR